MKEGFDREIDSLLRRRARGTAELRPWGDGASDGLHGAHLDADELSAFAEGVLPSAARVAVVTHLADCERCRGIVVGLARVAGAEVKPPAVAVPAADEPARPSAWRALVAALFAPGVMRLAVPVLALSLVGVVSYIALRSDKSGAVQMAREGRRSSAAANNEPSAGTSATDSIGNTGAPGVVEPNSSNSAPRETQALNAPPRQAGGHGTADAPTAGADPATEAAQPSGASPPPPAPAAVAPAEGPAEMSKAAPKTAATEEGETARADNKEKAESRDKDNRSARAQEPADDVTVNDALQQRRAANTRAYEQMPDGGARNSQKRAIDNNASGGYGNVANAAPSRESDRAGSRSETPARSRVGRQAEQKADDEQAPQTRTAAGHRFRRERNAWIDVNYRSSMPSTGVRRGTADFRALVAEVPEVGRVAAAIGGEVIVVVGGHAYHIR